MERLYITVKEHEKTKGKRIFGAAFEDISHAADGGLYAELVRNRSFEFDGTDHDGYHSLTAWSLVQRGYSIARVHVETAEPMYVGNPHYAVMEVITAGEGGGICNHGYNTGIAVKEGAGYRFTCFYKLIDGKAPVKVRLESADGLSCYGEETWVPEECGWHQVLLRLMSDSTDSSARLVLMAQQPLIIAFDMISLFPEDTFRNRENGLRRDLAEMIEALHPAFFRFPGGNIVSDGSLNARDRCSMYRWKNTVGPVWKRSVKRNPYSYCQSLGLGFYEYFQFCEDIGAEPIPVIPGGVDSFSLRAAPMDKMQEWIQDALDLIEFANGSKETYWGSVRASMGHEESFKLKYLEVGSDANGQEFYDRYVLISEAVREEHPEICLILSCGAGGGVKEALRGRKTASQTGTRIIDERIYGMPQWILANEDWFEQYGGEYELMVGGFEAGRMINNGNKRAVVLAESLLMLQMEKAPVVKMASFAPLLNNEGYSNWGRSLIHFDNVSAYGTGLYHVQKMFVQEDGGELLGTEAGWERREAGTPKLGGGIAMGTYYADIEVRQFLFHDMKTDRDIMLTDFELSEKKPRHECLRTDSSHYSVSFRFRKLNGTLAKALTGTGYFFLEFASLSKEERMQWRMDRTCFYSCLSGITLEGTCDLESCQVMMDPCCEHEARLEVDGNRVRAYLDGTEIHAHTCREPAVQPLYYLLSKTEDGNLFLRAVNWEQEKLLTLKLPGWKGGRTVIQSLDDQFWETEKNIEGLAKSYIREDRIKFSGEDCTILIPGQSVLAIKLCREG